jgi:hypothetical protein
MEKSADLLHKIYFLKDGFGLFNEVGNESAFISLIFLDIFRSSLQKLHTVEYPSYQIDIYVDKANPTMFILNDEESMRICKIVGKTIIIGDEVDIDFIPDCFYNKRVFYVNWNATIRTVVSLLFICSDNTFNISDIRNEYLRCRKKDRK